MNPADEPPARLRTFDEAEWLPLVDPAGWDPDEHRNRMNWEPVGPVRTTFEAWRRQQAWTLWSRARLAWHAEHGWPGGLDYVQLMQETVRIRRGATRLADPFRVEHG